MALNGILSFWAQLSGQCHHGNIINSNIALGRCPIPVKMNVNGWHQFHSTVNIIQISFKRATFKMSITTPADSLPFLLFSENSLWVFPVCYNSQLLCAPTPPPPPHWDVHHDSSRLVFLLIRTGGAEGKQSSRTGSVWGIRGMTVLSGRSSPSAFTSNLLRSI